MESKIPKELPLLNKLINLKGTLDLSNTALFAVQHLLGSNVPLILALNKMGLDFSNVFILGKVYSTNDEVVKKLRGLGIYVHPNSQKYKKADLTRDYNLDLSKAASETLQKAALALQKSPKLNRLLILDDGGVGIVATFKKFKNIKSEIVAVEQTRSGAEIIRHLNSASFPIINVAESDAKLTHESPYIAKSVIEEMTKKIKKLPLKKELKEYNILVVGYGAVGTEVARELSEKGIKVAVYDLDDKKLEVAKRNNHLPTELLTQLPLSDLIIGCVGKKWFPANFTDIVSPNTVLISASSSNVEFLGLQVVNGGKGDDFNNAHIDFKIEAKNNNCWVLNAGFPVNFDGSIDPIPPKTIQFTRALMLAGVYQAIEPKQKVGLTLLDKKLQNIIISEYKILSNIQN